MALRFDRGRLDSPRKTPQGGMRVPTFVGRTGILEYSDPKTGTIVREYRSPEEAFKADSLETLAGATVTLGHPPEKIIDPKSFRARAVGHVGDRVEKSDNFISADLIVNDGEAISAIDAGMREVSCGYRTDLVKKPGVTPEGERYDALQTNIRYNHIAIVRAGRAGSQCALRMDSEGHEVEMIRLDEEGDEILLDEQPKEKEMKIEMINGVEYEIGTPAHAAAVAARKDAERAHVKNDEAQRSHVEKLQAQHDVQTEKIKELNAKLAAATDQTKLDSLISERFALIENAKKLNPEVKIDGKSPREIMIEALAKASPSLKLDGKSDDYVSAAFDMARENKADESVAALNVGSTKVVKGDSVGDETADDAAVKKMRERSANAWKTAQAKA